MKNFFLWLLLTGFSVGQLFDYSYEDDDLGIFYSSLIAGLEPANDPRNGRHVSPDGRHECDRVCDKDAAPKTCEFDFVVEVYNTLSKACYDCGVKGEQNATSDCFREHCITGDGVERGIVVVNRRMPGEPVVVCLGDTVKVKVHNKLHTETFSIHWHGEHMRNGFQYMDGTPHVTQCPILPGANFKYEFVAATPGTHFWHSHTSFQRGDGAFGAYTVRQPDDPHAHLYDEDLTEHTIFVQEWFHISSREAFVLHHWDTGKNKADNLLVNGFGRLDNKRLGQSREATPTAMFKVESCKRYRFRVVSPGFTLCPIQVSVDSHDLLVIASDGNAIQPMQVKSLVIHPGERYDFVLNADKCPFQPPSGFFLMRFAGLFDCAKLGAHAVARLVYEDKGNDVEEDTKYEDCLDKEGPVLNPLNYAPKNAESAFEPKWIPISEAKAAHSASFVLDKEKADKVFYLGYDLYAKNNPHFHHEDLYAFEDVEGGNQLRTPQINNRTLLLPTSPPLTQFADIDKMKFCAGEEAEPECGDQEFCECIYILKVALNDVVELVLVDEGRPYDVSHPFHIHGHAFYVVAMERHALNDTHIGASSGGPGNSILRQTVIDMDKAGLIKRNLKGNPPLKDTVSVPDAGFTIVRFLADNPGFWLFHCHMSWHNHLGMGLVIQVGEIDDMPKAPENFPKCADFP